MRRAGVLDTINDVIRFCTLTASKAAGLAKLDDRGPDDTEVWGDAAVLSRPQAGAEALTIQLGDENVVLASRDQRWKVEGGPGEVVVRAMGPGSPAYIHLKPDGSCTVKASAINLGGSAANFVALANLVDARITALVDFINTHTHPAPGDNERSNSTSDASGKRCREQDEGRVTIKEPALCRKPCSEAA